MAQPDSYDVTILVNDVDVTQFVFYESMELDDYARQVSTFRFTIHNPSGITPAHMHPVVVIADSLPDAPIIFSGHIWQLKTRKRDNGITIEYDCDCQDKKALLQSAILGGNEFTGSDLDILGDLLSNAYPDWSGLFDFSSDINSLMDSLDFSIEDGMNLLDALNDLADLVGADWRLENAAGAPSDVTYELLREGNSATIVNQQFSETAEGNSGDPEHPGNAAALTEDSEAFPSDFRFEITITLPYSQEITRVTFDGYAAADTTTEDEVDLEVANEASSQKALMFDPAGRNAGWLSLDSDIDGTAMPFTDDIIRLTVAIPTSQAKTNIDFRIDNIVIYGDETYTINFDTKSALQWDSEPDAADYSIDVQTGDEYGSDIDFTIGSLDSFNSVTVVGGYEEIAIEKQLDSDGVRDHIGLPYPVKDIAVYVNTGTDTTPVWGSALDLGAWGSDTLTGEGGTKDVLLDAEHNVLFFDTAPPNLVNSYKVTGTIQRPIRVRIEDVAEGELTLATSHTDDTITSVDQAVAIGQAQLEQKNAIRQLSFKTNHPGLKPGQSITVADSARGLNETVTIRRIATTWMGPVGFFDVDCGDDDENSVDAMIANNDKRTRASGITTSPETRTAYVLTSNGENLTTDGQLLYTIG